MDTRTSRSKVLLTWRDILAAADEFDEDMRTLLEEIGHDARSAEQNSTTTGQGPWFIRALEVQGHVGIGEDPVRMSFPMAPGPTVVSARNGTGKTSLADAMRHAISGGATANEPSAHLPG